MSNFLAIATVTATLQQILQASVGTAVSGATVKTFRPEMSVSGAAEAHANLYLYQVTPNAGRRNVDLPTRNPAGHLVDRSQVALDLHYLISFYGDEGKLEQQRMLGSVVSTLNARPVLSRRMIRDTLASPSFNFLADSNLADEVELVKFTPASLSLEELSKLWSVFFQTPSTLSVAYQGTVVLIESQESHQVALPVRERKLLVAPFRQPVIEEVVSQTNPNEPIVVGSTLVLRGKFLSGEITQVRIGGVAAVTPIVVNDTEISLPLTEPPLVVGSIRAGVQGVQVVHPVLLGTPPVPHRGVESNVSAFVLHPTITAVTASNPQASVTVKLKPDVGPAQRVVLLLSEFGGGSPDAYSFTAPSRAIDTDSITIQISGVKTADYLVRVQIDGAESPLGTNAVGQYDSPTVTIP